MKELKFNRKAKLKESLYILKEAENIYQVVFTATRRIKRFHVDNLVKDTIDSLKVKNDLEEIILDLKNKYPEVDIVSCINSLELAGIITTYNEKDIKMRDQRQISFIEELTSSWEETIELHRRLKNATVAVFGIGGIGTWIVNGLYQIGIESIRISDPDKVSEDNLNRHLYFNETDIGKFKVDVIKDKIGNAKIQAFKKIVSPEEDLEEIMFGCNFIVNCADYPSVAETARIINKYAIKNNIPYSIAGGYNMHLGMVGPIIVPGKTACLDCFLKYQEENGYLANLEKIKDVEQTGSLGPIAGVIANLHVIEIFKFITGKGSLNLNKFAEIDFMNFHIEWKEYSKKQNCKICSSNSS